MTQVDTLLNNPQVVRVNELLDQLTGKMFSNQQVFVDAIRAVLHFNGLNLPHLECEQEIAGPGNAGPDGDLMKGPGHKNSMQNVPHNDQANDFEYVFEIKYGSIQKHTIADIEGQPSLFVYMVCCRVAIPDQGPGFGLWEAYAQLVDEDALNELLDLDIPSLPRTFPALAGNIAGETDYTRQVRHSQGNFGKDA